MKSLSVLGILIKFGVASRSLHLCVTILKIIHHTPSGWLSLSSAVPYADREWIEMQGMPFLNIFVFREKFFKQLLGKVVMDRTTWLYAPAEFIKLPVFPSFSPCASCSSVDVSSGWIPVWWWFLHPRHQAVQQSPRLSWSQRWIWMC